MAKIKTTTVEEHEQAAPPINPNDFPERAAGDWEDALQKITPAEWETTTQVYLYQDDPVVTTLNRAHAYAEVYRRAITWKDVLARCPEFIAGHILLKVSGKYTKKYDLTNVPRPSAPAPASPPSAILQDETVLKQLLDQLRAAQDPVQQREILQQALDMQHTAYKLSLETISKEEPFVDQLIKAKNAGMLGPDKGKSDVQEILTTLDAFGLLDKSKKSEDIISQVGKFIETARSLGLETQGAGVGVREDWRLVLAQNSGKISENLRGIVADVMEGLRDQRGNPRSPRPGIGGASTESKTQTLPPSEDTEKIAEATLQYHAFRKIVEFYEIPERTPEETADWLLETYEHIAQFVAQFTADQLMAFMAQDVILKKIPQDEKLKAYCEKFLAYIKKELAG